MKTMTCKELGGACDVAFQAETFEELAEKSRAHGMKMVMKMDKAHLAIMAEMKELMKSPEAMEQWMAEKKAAFDALPED